MDILGNSTMRQIITEYYQSSDEPKFVRNAIIAASVMDGLAPTKTVKQQFHYALYGARRYKEIHEICLEICHYYNILTSYKE